MGQEDGALGSTVVPVSFAEFGGSEVAYGQYLAVFGKAVGVPGWKSGGVVTDRDGRCSSTGASGPDVRCECVTPGLRGVFDALGRAFCSIADQDQFVDGSGLCKVHGSEEGHGGICGEDHTGLPTDVGARGGVTCGGGQGGRLLVGGVQSSGSGGDVGGDQASGLAAGREAGALGGRSFVTGCGGLGFRGPNWHRNQVTKMRRRIKRQEEREKYVAEQAVADYEAKQRESAGVSPALASRDWRVKTGVSVRSESEQKLHELKVRRQILQEERKLKKLTSPMQQLEDAMAMIRISEAAAKAQNDHKVAGWAKTLSDSYALSIARSASSSPVSIDSLGSVTSASELPRQVPRPVVPRFGSAAGSGSVVSSSSSRSGVVDHLNMSGQAAREAAATRRLKEIGLIDSDGRVFTRDTADRFVRNYACIRAVATVDKSDEEIARLTDVPVHVVRQYFLLRKEFRLK